MDDFTTRNYVFDEAGNPHHEPDLTAWAQWYGTTDRVVQRDQVGEAIISTVFLGVDHRHVGSGPPILWETMVFGISPNEGDQQRYVSRAEALAGHVEWVERERNGPA